MIFADLTHGDSVFVDANTLIYHFSPHPVFGAACRQLVQRIESQDLLGFTSTHTLGEAAHQLMLVEALTLPGWSAGKVKKRLRQQPAALQKLMRFRAAVETVLQPRITVLTIAPDLLGTAATISQQCGLLTNDALTVALMQANGLTKIASHDTDYAAFERVLRQAKDNLPMRLLAYCLMPNHFHLVLWPHQDGELSDFLHWLTLTHTMRWHAHYHSAGTGPLYQGRFKSFPVQEDDHLLTVCRYVERNALRAQLVPSAERWPWASLARRVEGRGQNLLDGWPVSMPVDWQEHVNGVETASELAALRRSVRRGTPFGNATWQQETAQRLGLESTLRPLGRPRKRPPTPSTQATLFDTSRHGTNPP